MPTSGYYQVAGLVNLGVQVILYCGAILNPIKGLHYQRETLRFGGLRLPLRLLGIRRAVALHDRIVARNLQRIHEKDRIDIVHCWPSGALETLKVARELGIKTVLERPSAHTRFVMEVTARECSKLGLQLDRRHYAAFDMEKLVHEEQEFALADFLLCPSEFVVKTFLDKGFAKERLLRHQYGCDPTVFFPPKSGPNRQNNSSFTVLYVGDCFPLKGLHFALEAWVGSKASEHGRFVICGRFVRGYREILEKWLQHPSIRYIPFVDSVADIMRSSDVLVLPSLAEGFGNVTCEARTCGCVLLVSNAASGACEHMKTGLVHKTGDVDTLRQHIDLLASDRKLFLQLRNNSLATAHEWTWEKAGQVLLQAYRKCLDETHS
ncbi:MAG: glycosyltransferase family 4 protein [Planctomycetota bacterium]|nr:glycosyltransferase family 4 protein [Planctomycetota bacterium]